MGSWLNNLLDQATPVDDGFNAKRTASLAELRELPWPSRKIEAWKYTQAKAIENSQYRRDIDAPAVCVDEIPGLSSLDIVVIDGRLRSVPESLPEGISITPIGKASADEHNWAYSLFADAKPNHHYFGLVNDVLARDGVLIKVDTDVQVKQPIRLVNVITEGKESHCRHLIRLGERAKATIVEQTIGNSPSFNTQVTEYQLCDDAHCDQYRLALETGETLSVSGSHFNLANRSKLESHLVGFGSKLSRIDIDINHRGEHALAQLNGVYLLDGDEHFDLHTTIEHERPNGTTQENIRGIVADSSHAVFNGRIHIHRGAQKTLAELNNRNLLLSRKAEVDTKPELEIYADDVQCAHGATIAEIDKEALYYLHSRGVGEKDALLMLNFGFINELLEQIPNHNIAGWLNQQLRDRFERMNSDE